MSNVIVVQDKFDGAWPFAANYWYEKWSLLGKVELIRQVDEEKPLSALLKDFSSISRLVVLGIPITTNCINFTAKIKEVYIETYSDKAILEKLKSAWKERGTIFIERKTEGMWGQSVSEFGLALTLAGLRRIPQEHIGVLTKSDVWNHKPQVGNGRPGLQGHQYSDTSDFTSGTIEGKRIRIIGAGNIASRYASFVKFLGADVASWDPFASEPCFHRSGSRQIHHIKELIKDAEILVPMLPLTDSTRGLVTKEYIDLIPKKALVVMVTRMEICDYKRLYERVSNNELALAADVFDIEPLPVDHVLVGRENVVHTPHIAGRTKQANESFSQALMNQFTPI